MKRLVLAGMALALACVAFSEDSGNRFGDGDRFGNDFYKTVEILDEEISPRRLDLALETILSRNPPMGLHGQLYGWCPLYAVEGTPLAVFCLGFWDYATLRSRRDASITRGIEILYVGKARCEAQTFDVRWEEGKVEFEGNFDGSHYSEPPDAATMDYCHRLTCAVLDRCTAKDWRTDAHVIDFAAAQKRYLDYLDSHGKNMANLTGLFKIEIMHVE